MKISFKGRAALALVCTQALLAPGCGVEPVIDPIATETGNPYGDSKDEGVTSGGCDQAKTPLELAAPSPLGFDAQSIVDLVTGEHPHALRWLADTGFEYGPESGTSTITLSVEPLGTARFVDRSPAMSSGGEEILLEPIDGCRDSIELDVRLRLETGGGALSESVETTVEAYASDFALGSVSIELDALVGSFEAALVAPAGGEITRATLSAQVGFSEYGSVGALSVSTELRTAGGAVGQSAGSSVAVFPADDYCGGPNAVSVLADQPVRGVSLAALLDGLNAQTPTSVVYTPAGNGELELEFTADAERVCITFDRDVLYNGEAGGAQLSVPGRVRVQSDDGKLDGSFAVQLGAQTAGGALQLRAEAAEDTQDVATAAELPARFGVVDDVSVDGYDGASVRFESYSEAGVAGGSVIVSGLDVPECISNPPPIDPDANSTPGCRGIDRIPLWSARWGAP